MGMGNLEGGGREGGRGIMPVPQLCLTEMALTQRGTDWSGTSAKPGHRDGEQGYHHCKESLSSPLGITKTPSPSLIFMG